MEAHMTLKDLSHEEIESRLRQVLAEIDRQLQEPTIQRSMVSRWEPGASRTRKLEDLDTVINAWKTPRDLILGLFEEVISS